MTETPENDRPDREPTNDTPDADAIDRPDPSGVAPYEPVDSPGVDAAGDAGETNLPAGVTAAGVGAESGTDRPATPDTTVPPAVAAESGTDEPATPDQAAATAERAAVASGGDAAAAAAAAPIEAEIEDVAPPEALVAPEAAAGVPGEPTGVGETPEQPAQAGPAAAPPAESGVVGEDEGETPGPRVRPEIPGADLTPDIVPEGLEYLDAEARAAAEADAEAAAAAAAAAEERDASLPIADAAIDLAAGARYTATGKRKTAVARVILKPGTGTYSINGKPLEAFFPRETLQRIIRQPLETVGYESRMDVVARMHGGGVAAQAGALRHGISRALIVADPNLRGELKRRGFLTRDPRVKERKKAGLKKARKRPQFSKR